jgi:hypothetical protein
MIIRNNFDENLIFLLRMEIIQEKSITFLFLSSEQGYTFVLPIFKFHKKLFLKSVPSNVPKNNTNERVHAMRLSTAKFNLHWRDVR